MSWLKSSHDVLTQVYKALPKNATEEDRYKAVRDAYPFGERERFPYKMWLQACKEWKKAWDKGYRP